MFFCIGENSESSLSIGEGETIEKAIASWARYDEGGELGEILQEFRECNPSIYEGKELKIELEYPPPIIKIL